MMFTICVTYAVVSPIILIWGLIYFIVAYFTYTYQLIYVFKKSNDTGGATFPAIYGRLNNGMIIGQLVIVAMFVLVDSIVCAAIFLLVTVYTIATKSREKMYAYYFKSTSVSSAKKESVGTMNLVTKGENNFIAPAVKALKARRAGKEASEDQKDAGSQNPAVVSKQSKDNAHNDEKQSEEQIQKSDGNKENREVKDMEDPPTHKIEMS